MITILGLLGFCGLTGVVYWLFYRLVWNSASDEPEFSRLLHKKLRPLRRLRRMLRLLQRQKLVLKAVK